MLNCGNCNPLNIWVKLYIDVIWRQMKLASNQPLSTSVLPIEGKKNNRLIQFIFPYPHVPMSWTDSTLKSTTMVKQPRLRALKMVYIPMDGYYNVEISWVIVVPLVIIHFNGIFPYKASILGYAHFRKARAVEHNHCHHYLEELGRSQSFQTTPCHQP